jgi:hypothetical protein
MGFEYSTDAATGDRIGRQLFPIYDLDIDLPRAGSVQEFVVPEPPPQPRSRK